MIYKVRQYELRDVRLVLSRYEGRLTDAEHDELLQRYAQQMLEAQRDRVRLITMVDLSVSENFSAKQRRRQSEWNRETDQLTLEVMLGLGFVAPNPLSRGVMTAVFWLQPPKVPYFICSSLAEALTWTFQVCVDNSISPSISECSACRNHFASWP